MTDSRSPTQEAGQITAFVVIFAAALLLLGGLVIDGGYMLAGKRRAEAEADAAARAGAQAISLDTYRRTGVVVLDPTATDAAAHEYLRQTGHTGEVHLLDQQTVEVHVTFSQPLSILSIVGLGSVTVTGIGRAKAARAPTSGSP